MALFEQQLHYPIRQLSEDRLTERFFNELDVLIVPSGYYSNLLDNEGKGALMQWIRKGDVSSPLVMLFDHLLITMAFL